MRPNGIVMIASSEFGPPANGKNPGRGVQISGPVETNPGSSRMRLGPANDGSLLPSTARARTIETSPATTRTRLSFHSAHRLAPLAAAVPSETPPPGTRVLSLLAAIGTPPTPRHPPG